MTCTNCGCSAHNIKTCPKLRDLSIDMESGGEAGRLKDRSASFMTKGGCGIHPETANAEREVQKMKKLDEMRQKLSPMENDSVMETNMSGASASASAGLPPVPGLPPIGVTESHAHAGASGSAGMGVHLGAEAV